MRFKNEPVPEVGDERWRSEFLFFPRRIGDETRWLERAEWVEVWSWFGVPGWTATEWVEPTYILTDKGRAMLKEAK